MTKVPKSVQISKSMPDKNVKVPDFDLLSEGWTPPQPFLPEGNPSILFWMGLSALAATSGLLFLLMLLLLLRIAL